MQTNIMALVAVFESPLLFVKLRGLILTHGGVWQMWPVMVRRMDDFVYGQ